MSTFNILVPLDFSDISTIALHSAQTIAKIFDARITPFHSYVPISETDSAFPFGGASLPVENYEEIEESLVNRLEEVANEEIDKQYLMPPKISIGNPAAAIAEEAKTYDMVVMTSHGRTGFSRFFLGSVSEKVLRSSHTPVLIVNKERELEHLNRIMVTTDFSEHSKEAFPWVLKFAQKTGANVELVHIHSYDTEEADSSVTSLRKQRLNLIAKEEFHMINDQIHTKLLQSAGTPYEAILKYNLENPHDLIIMSTLGHTGISYLMMGSTTANVVRHVKSAVLSINPKQDEQTVE